jgi:Protein of unknown function (DUF3558)
MRPMAATFIVASSALLLAACGSPATTGGSAGPTGAAAASTAAAAASSAAATQSAPATALDPCQLVTSSEASSLAGTSYGAGKEETSGSGKSCVYGADTTNVFTVEVGQAPDATTANHEWSKEQAQAQALIKQKVPAGVGITVHAREVAGLADRADTIYGSTALAGQTIGFSGIYLLKGVTVLAFQDILLGHAPPSTADMQSEARTALGRVP